MNGRLITQRHGLEEVTIVTTEEATMVTIEEVTIDHHCTMRTRESRNSSGLLALGDIFINHPKK